MEEYLGWEMEGGCRDTRVSEQIGVEWSLDGTGSLNGKW